MSLYKVIIIHTADNSASGTYSRTRACSILLDWQTTHTHYLPSVKVQGDISVQVYREAVDQKMVFILGLSTV
jgi:hypothetical protein